MTTLDIHLSCAVLTCCHTDCGISFAVPSWWEQKKREDHSFWTCPNGHSQHFSGRSDKEKLQATIEERDRELVRTRARADQLKADRDAKERQLSAQKGVTTRLRNRAQAGMCPCCKRSFTNMARHMQTKHAEWSKSQD